MNVSSSRVWISFIYLTLLKAVFGQRFHVWTPWMYSAIQSFSSPSSCSTVLNPSNSLIQLETKHRIKLVLFVCLVFHIKKKNLTDWFSKVETPLKSQAGARWQASPAARPSWAFLCVFTRPLSPSSPPHLFQIDLIPCQQFKPLPWQHQSKGQLQILLPWECSGLAAFQEGQRRERGLCSPTKECCCLEEWVTRCGKKLVNQKEGI